MVYTLLVNANQLRYIHPLADDLTKLRIFPKVEISEFSAFPFLLQLMFDQTLTNLIVCLMISQKKMSHKVVQTS